MASTHEQMRTALQSFCEVYERLPLAEKFRFNKAYDQARQALHASHGLNPLQPILDVDLADWRIAEGEGDELPARQREPYRATIRGAGDSGALDIEIVPPGHQEPVRLLIEGDRGAVAMQIWSGAEEPVASMRLDRRGLHVSNGAVANVTPTQLANVIFDERGGHETGEWEPEADPDDAHEVTP